MQRCQTVVKVFENIYREYSFDRFTTTPKTIDRDISLAGKTRMTIPY